MKIKRKSSESGFTLVELLISISLLGIITLIVSSLFIDSFKQSSKFAVQNSVYEDARFIMDQLVDEIRSSRIDYDEYYNQKVVLANPALFSGESNLKTYGQNFGFYYSSFFNPGTDGQLGYDCNNGQRNGKNCTPIRGTLDRATGQNPFMGKPSAGANGGNIDIESAFCLNCGLNVGTGLSELYLISPDSHQKTIITRERIGGNNATPIYALSRVRISGVDTNSDGRIDAFSCADGYSCGASNACVSADGVPAGLPRKDDDLNPPDQRFNEACDNRDNGFSHDFVPVSPLRIDVTDLKFDINPVEDPAYAFGESTAQRQPTVTITMTVRPNPEVMTTQASFEPFTLLRTVTAGTGAPIVAPLRVN